MNSHPATEARDAAAADLDLRSTPDLVALMNREDAVVPTAVADAADAVAAVVDEVVERLRRGGRLLYIGAGTSGRLAELDAAECEAAEDDDDAGIAAIARLRAGSRDAVIAVSASGRTPFTLGAARAAADAGAFTACVACVEESPLAEFCEREIAVVVGPEVLAGSTRLKAGTAQKLVLNTISTVAMIRLGKTYAGLMVDVVPANEKLRGRVRRIVGTATGASDDAVDAALAEADGDAKVAIVTLLAGIDAEAARVRLEASG